MNFDDPFVSQQPEDDSLDDDYYLLDLENPDESEFDESETMGQSGLRPNQIDNFMIRVYRYFLFKGYLNLIISQIVDLTMLTFLVFFAMVLFQCIDYDALMGATDPGVKYHISQFVKMQNLLHPSVYFVICLILYGFYMAWKVLRISYDVRVMRGIQNFYREKLKISDFELGTIRWSRVVDKIMQLQQNPETKFYGGGDKLNYHNVANRLMRKENYMIAMITQRVIHIKYKGFVMFTKSLEWNLNWIILNYFFDKHQCVKVHLLDSQNREETIRQLRKRFIVMAVVNALLTPFALLFASLYILFEHGHEFYRNPSEISGRNWSLLAKWKFKQYNELPHVFYERMRIAAAYGNQYLDQFPNLFSQVFKLVAFMMSTFIVFILFLTWWNDRILFIDSVLRFMSIASAVLIVSKTLAKKTYIFYPQAKLKKVAKYVHYIPKRWQGTAQSSKTRSKFTKLFELRLFSIFKEIASIIVNPLILGFYFPSRVERILDFIQHHTVNHPQLGPCCGFSVFEFEKDEDTNIDLNQGLTVNPAGESQTTLANELLGSGSGGKHTIAEHTIAEQGSAGANDGSQLDVQLSEFVAESLQNKLEKSAKYFYRHQELEEQTNDSPFDQEPQFDPTTTNLESSVKYEYDDTQPQLYTSSLLIPDLETMGDQQSGSPKKTTIFDLLAKARKK